MKKLIVILFLFLTFIIVGTYTVLFTAPGNDFVASQIEKKANEGGQVDFKVKTFVLTMGTIDFLATVDDNSQIKVKGDLSIINQSADLNFDINVKELAKLEKLTGQKFNGSFQTKGSVKGNSKLMNIVGDSGVAGSQTAYRISLVDLKPKDINATVTNAKIEKLLYMLNQPIYAKGNVSVDAKLVEMAGDITTTVANGLVHNEVVNKAFNQKLKAPLKFNGEVLTKLTKEQAVSKVDFYTTMANLFVKEAVVKLDNMHINSDYLVKVDDLSKLYDVAQMKLRGAVALNGEVKKDDDLSVTGASKLLDGTLNFKLLNDDLNATLKGLELKKVLYTIYAPEFFRSKTDLSMNYDLKAQKGEVKGALLKGQFERNEYSNVINQLARFDITKEVYESVNLNSQINKNIIQSTVDMKSALTTIKVPSSTLDTKKQTVEALVQTTIKKIEFDTNISGPLNKPKIKIDTSKLIKSGIKEKAGEKLEKKIKEKLGDDAGNLLKGLFQ